MAAIEAGVPSAMLLPSASPKKISEQLRIAFDGDAVLFFDEAEKIYKAEGLEAFKRHEAEATGVPLSGGPLRPLLAALHVIQSLFPADNSPTVINVIGIWRWLIDG